MSIEFSTHQYQASHGKQPRGTGNWAFAQIGEGMHGEIIWASGSYIEAKQQVAAKLRARGIKHATLAVLP